MQRCSKDSINSSTRQGKGWRTSQTPVRLNSTKSRTATRLSSSNSSKKLSRRFSNFERESRPRPQQQTNHHRNTASSSYESTWIRRTPSTSCRGFKSESWKRRSTSRTNNLRKRPRKFESKHKRLQSWSPYPQTMPQVPIEDRKGNGSRQGDFGQVEARNKDANTLSFMT